MVFTVAGFQEVILRELGWIKEEIQVIKSWVKRGEGAWSCPISIPLKSEADLNSAETLLSSDATRNAYVSLGGTYMQHSITSCEFGIVLI